MIQFGEDAAMPISREFVQYKKFMGLRKHAVLPESVPHENYLTEMFLQMVGATVPKGKQPFKNPHMSMSPEPANPEEWWARKRARRARAEGKVESHQPPVSQPPAGQPPLLLQPPPPAHSKRRGSRQSQSTALVRPVSRSVAEKIERPPSTKARMPYQIVQKSQKVGAAQLSNHGHSKDEGALVTIPAMVYPIPKHLQQGHRASVLQDIFELQEEADEQIPHGIPHSRTPQQPTPITAKQAMRNRNPRPTGSECSLVKRFNIVVEAAEQMDAVEKIEAAEKKKATRKNYLSSEPSSRNVEYDGSAPAAPKINVPPKVPHWRYDTPRPRSGVIPICKVEAPADKGRAPVDKGKGKSMGKGKGKGKAKARPEAIIIEPESPSPILASPSVATPLRSAPMFVICDSPELTGDALARVSVGTPKSGSRSSLIPPRPRRRLTPNGISPQFRERGLPTPAFLEESFELQKKQAAEYSSSSSSSSSSAATSPPLPPKLVSISTPEAEYSCATQACWCSSQDPDADVCPACAERRRLGRELKMEWL